MAKCCSAQIVLPGLPRIDSLSRPTDHLRPLGYRSPCTKADRMRPPLGRRQFLAGTALAALSSAAGCGTILYPERRGQTSGQLDWGIVMLDGIGLLLFFIPGVIAFAVDFATGTIYLPSEPQHFPPAGPQPTALKRIQVDSTPLTRESIAQAVTAETGEPVALAEGEYLSAELEHLEDFWPTRDRLAGEYAN